MNIDEILSLIGSAPLEMRGTWWVLLINSFMLDAPTESPANVKNQSLWCSLSHLYFASCVPALVSINYRHFQLAKCLSGLVMYRQLGKLY